MKTDPEKHQSVDDYIADFPTEVQGALRQIRKLILDCNSEITEIIAYNIPTYKLDGNLIHFAAYKSHIGLYPGPAALNHFSSEITNYKTAKGSVQFPLKEPMPFELIKQITEFCIDRHLQKTKPKKNS